MYARETDNGIKGEIVEVEDKFVDFQIVLNADEISALISRKRISSRSDIHLPKNEMMASSVHSAHPFVDSTRLLQNYFRTDQPDKWKHKTSIRAMRK